MYAMMERLGEILNLKKHFCIQRDGARIELPTACDVEGHLGTDGRYYVVDCARFFPPEPPKYISSYQFILPNSS
jgi:hypothetical protein